MLKKRTIAKTAAVSFGAAMTSMYAAPELQADVLDITFTPGSLAFSTNSNLTPISMATVGGNIGSFSQWNDNIGKTMTFASTQLSSWAIVYNSSILRATTFAGITGSLGFGTASSGTVYVGFRSTAGNVGWFAVNLGGVGGDVVYGPGQYGNNGEAVHVGGAIPEPAGATGLAALALGAIGLRRRRKKAA